MPHPWLTAGVVVLAGVAPLWLLESMGIRTTRENVYGLIWTGAMGLVASYFVARAVLGKERVDGIVNRILELLLGK